MTTFVLLAITLVVFALAMFLFLRWLLDCFSPYEEDTDEEIVDGYVMSEGQQAKRASVFPLLGLPLEPNRVATIESKKALYRKLYDALEYRSDEEIGRDAPRVQAETASKKFLEEEIVKPLARYNFGPEPPEPGKAACEAKPTCDTCDDTGKILAMACYGGQPTEITIDCPDCKQ